MNNMTLETERYASVLSDAGFHAVLADSRNKDILIEIINLLLNGERVIKDLTYRNEDLAPNVLGKKEIRLDLFCVDECGAGFVVEMQKERHSEFFAKRSIYYGSRAMDLQVDKGSTSYDYQPVYVIGLLEGRLGPESFADGKLDDASHPISYYDMTNRRTGKRMVPTISCIFVELGNFTKRAEECCGRLDECLYIIKNSSMLQAMPFASDGDIADRLLTACEVAGFDANKRIRYNNDKMSEIDRKYEMANERAEGRAEGIAEGKSEGRTEVARTMLADGLDCSFVSKYSGLSIEQVEKLRQSL